MHKKMYTIHNILSMVNGNGSGIGNVNEHVKMHNERERFHMTQISILYSLDSTESRWERNRDEDSITAVLI